MEKTTKKRKKAKGARKRIGIIAVGGLSLVLTICLSVGATLAWFAGSTWSSNQLFMGGPVYVEMAGRGAAGATAGNGSSTAKWQGGAGNLDIKAATSRTTGTASDQEVDLDGEGSGTTMGAPSNILLPGQKFEIYSQARVFSTSYTTSVGQNTSTSMNSGSNVTNTSKSGTAHITDRGRVTSTTTSVLRARFSVNVEFDPTVGFNNFTQASYYNHYPVQSGTYGGDKGSTATTTWQGALGATAYKGTLKDDGDPSTPEVLEYPNGSRRDAVPNVDDADAGTKKVFTAALSNDAGTEGSGILANDFEKIKTGKLKSIYSWKFVSSDVYFDTNKTKGGVTATCGTPNRGSTEATTDMTGTVTNTGLDKGYKYLQMKAPFDGSVLVDGVGFYGVWILKSNGASGSDEKMIMSESDSFYKARCNSYIDSYVEEYMTEYGEVKTRTIGASLASLENSLNQSFVNLVNEASNHILAGEVNGMTVENGIVDYAEAISADARAKTQATWLYIDPSIGNDTNTNELSTGTGGWWYLVQSDNTDVSPTTGGGNKVAITRDSATYTAGNGSTPGTWSGDTNTPTEVKLDGTGSEIYATTPTNNASTATFFTRDVAKATDTIRLDAKLYEINPLQVFDSTQYKFTGGNEGVNKIVSYSFPFVNGTAALPGDALTNVFANAKITIQISFQALQAFFPFSTNIDNMTYTNPLLGTAKALSIKNAIPIFNEAFDYQETISVETLRDL